MRIDSTLLLASRGYGWLPDARRRTGRDTVDTRLAGQRAVALCGPDAARFFYDERHVRRHGALPEPVLDTLFGRGAVHTLDGEAHLVRKTMFLALMTGGVVDPLVELTAAEWERAVRSWAGRPSVVLMDEASVVITRAVCRWAGIPLDDAEAPALAADLVTLVDGFGTVGPRNWRARRARGRREAWLAGLVADARSGAVTAPTGSALEAVARHRDADGTALDPHTAAVELLNVIRPTVAVSWFVVFAAHALHRWPQYRARLAEGDVAYAEAFAHEVRRFYPFAPFVGGRAVTDLHWDGVDIPAGAMVLLDLYGQNHDQRLWPKPYRFDPDRFVGRLIEPFELVPQGGGDPRSGHRCPGEQITVDLLRDLVVRLARLDYAVPGQDLRIPLHRMPTLPVSRFVIADVRLPDRTPAAHRPGAV